MNEYRNIFGNLLGFSADPQASEVTFTSSSGTIYYETVPLRTLAENLIKIPYIEKGDEDDKTPAIDAKPEAMANLNATGTILSPLFIRFRI